MAQRDKTRAELNYKEQLTFAHQKKQELELYNMKRTLSLLRDQQVPTKTLTVRFCGIFPLSELFILICASLNNTAL